MLIKDRDKDQLIRIFSEKLIDPVELILFTQTEGNPDLQFVQTCDWCRNTEELLRELASLSDKLSIRTVDFVNGKDAVDRYGIDKIPAIIPVSKKDYGIRFFGIPIGYEFTSLIEGIIDVSRGSADLGERTLERLTDIEKETFIQVFVSPTCPYCPGAVRTAHRMAVASEEIAAAMVEIQEFPHLAQRYGVMGVPKVVINETESFEGAIPESLFLLHVLKAAEIISKDEMTKLDLYQREV